MSSAEVSWIIGVTVVLPFAAAAMMVVAGGAARMRRMLAVGYAVLAAGFNLALLNGYLERSGRASWGAIKFTSFSFPAFLVLNMLTVGAVLYAGFRMSGVESPALLMASIPAACGFGALALVVATLLPFVLLWLAVSAVALLGLFAHGSVGFQRRLRAFAPWLAADALLVIGALLCSAWLKESALLIKPPTVANEAQTVTVVAFFLASALIRLGVFPLHWWTGDLVSRTDASWSSFYLGTVNFLLAGTRLVVAIVLLGRLVAGDWSLVLGIAALFSVVAGPMLAVRGRTVPSCSAGLYCMQSGFLLLSLALFSRAGLESGLFVLLTAPLFLTAFLMATGTATGLRGSTALGRQLLPVGAAPAAFGAMLLAGIAIAGLPPTDGFVGKAMVSLACFDKGGVNQFFMLAMAAALIGIAVSLVSVARLSGGVFSTGAGGGSVQKPAFMEGLVPLAICAVSVLLGAFPSLLLSNFIQRGSRLLFATGFTGPGIAFKGTGDIADAALRTYPAWGSVVGAFLLAVAALALVAYFASRAANPSAGPEQKFAPFLGGADGEYSWSMQGTLDLLPRRMRRRLPRAREAR
jgi:formate hydrogenlyase subunit 3/multisubunit Na+/H+ antiporter MnhD subunit